MRRAASSPVEKSVGERVLTALFPAGPYGALSWTSDRREQVKHYTHWVYVASRAKQKRVGRAAPNVARVGAPTNGTKAFRPSSTARPFRRFAKALGPVKPHEQLAPVGDNHPVVRLFKNPNGPDVASDLWDEIVLFLDLTGNSYVWMVPAAFQIPLTGKRGVSELWVLPSHWVTPRSQGTCLVDYYEVRPFGGMSAGMLNIPAEDMIHLRWKSPLSKVDGHSPLTAGSEWIDIEEGQARAEYAHLKNSCRPELHIELGPSYEDPDDDTLERIYAKFFRRFQGENKTGLPLITPPGAKVTPLNLPGPEQWAATKEASRDMVLALLGVPGVAVGLSKDMTFGSVMATLFTFYDNEVNPLRAKLGEVFTERLARRYDPSLRIWWDDDTPQDPAQVNADLDLDLKYGVRTLNEARAVRGLEDYAHGGDDPLIPNGSSPMGFGTGEEFAPLPGEESLGGELAQDGWGGAPAKPNGMPPGLKARMIGAGGNGHAH